VKQYNQLPISPPEAHGIPSSAVLRFVDAIEQNRLELHSFVLLRHGHVLAQAAWAPYRLDVPHMLFSVSKSFTATAIGLAIHEGRLSLDDTVLSFFPDDAPANPSQNLQAMRVRHLLSMSTGHAQDTLNALGDSDNWARIFLRQPVQHAPGTHFVYNSGASYMLSAIVQQLTGMTLLDYLQPRLFEPLGIRDATWESCPRGINLGGWGLSIRTADIASFGQLYLQQGEWHGRQIVPPEWVAEASSAQISNANQPNIDWQQGYGYQFWRCRHGAYRGDGAFGQFCIVMPEQAAVLATTAGLGDMQAVLNCVWEHLLPAMQATALPENPKAGAELEQRTAGLALPVLRSRQRPPLAAQVSGRTFVFDANQQQARTVRYDFSDDRCTLIFGNRHGTHTLVCGDGIWLDGQTGYHDGVSRPVSATGAWIDEHTFELRLRYLGTPFGFTITSTFDGRQVAFDHNDTVSFGPTKRPRLVGRSHE